MVERLSVLLWVSIVCFLGAWYQEANTPRFEYQPMDFVLMPYEVQIIRIIGTEWRR